MRHRRLQNKCGRNATHRLAMLRNMATSLFDAERIVTTEAKAKAARSFVEKIITLAKQDNLHARRLILRDIHDKDVVKKLFDVLAARYDSRKGGYTRIIRTGFRRGDAAPMAILELVDRPDTSKDKKGEKKSVLDAVKQKVGRA